MQNNKQPQNIHPNLTGVIFILMFVLVAGIITNNTHHDLAMQSADDENATRGAATRVVQVPPTESPTLMPTLAPTDTPEPTATTPPTSTPQPPTVSPEDSATENDDVTSGANNPADYDPALVSRGQELFVACAACHGADAKGVPNLGKDLVDSEFVHSQTDEELVQFIITGRPIWDANNTTGIDMPPKGGNPALTGEDIQAIVAYIRSLSAD